jgi:hypothetical protein
MRRSVKVAYSSFIEGSHTTKNTASVCLLDSATFWYKIIWPKDTAPINNTAVTYCYILTLEKGDTTVNYHGIFITLTPAVNFTKLVTAIPW